MFTKVLIVVTMILNVYSENINNDNYADSIIDMLLNGDDSVLVESEEDNEGEEPIFKDGIWQCGKCDSLGKMKLLYSEENEVDIADMDYDLPTEVQIGLAVDNMLCVTVDADESTAIRRVSGHCDGSHVTLAVMSQQRFNVRAYGN